MKIAILIFCQECNEIIETMERSAGIRFLWNNLKPLVRGKILFTPDTPATRKIVKKVNETFAAGMQVRQLLEDWNTDYSTRLRQMILDEDNQAFLKQFFTSENSGFINMLGL